MEEIRIKAYSRRREIGSSASARIRKQGFLPAIVYGSEFNLPVKIKKQDVKVLQQHHFSENILINLEIEENGKSKSIPVLLKDYQRHPLTEEVIHLDFIKVSMEQEVVVKVPVEIKGEAQGVKEGGVLQHLLWELEVECLPRDIPESIVVDISSLKIGDSLHVGDLKLPENVRAVSEATEAVVTISSAMKEEEEELVLQEEEEPEVIKEKPKEDKTSE